MSFYRSRDIQENSHILYATLGPLEIALIVIAVILVFGVGKLGEIGDALGKSIREFNREKNKVDNVPPSTMVEGKEEETPRIEAIPKDETKD